MSLKNVIAILVSTSAFISSNAQAQHAGSFVKSMDGAAAYCPKTEFENPLAHDKTVKIERIQENESNLTLRVSLVKCDAGTWKMDANPMSEKFSVKLSENAVVAVEKTYSNYQLLILSKDSEIVATKDLQNLESQSVEAVSIDLGQAKLNQYEVVLRVKNSMKASNGATEETHYSTFGSYLLNL